VPRGVELRVVEVDGRLGLLVDIELRGVDGRSDLRPSQVRFAAPRMDIGPYRADGPPVLLLLCRTKAAIKRPRPGL
jgi:hypothetical protein